MVSKKPLPIIYEDAYIIAINKPPRIGSVASLYLPENETVLGMLRRQLKPQGISPYPLHRLDYATSGAMLFGKNEKDRAKLEAIFGTPSTKKTYLALVKGMPRSAGVITKKLPSRNSGELIDARTEYKTIRVFRAKLAALVEATISTGRKHQIRQHMAAIHSPIVMDDKYGDREFNRKFRRTFRLGRQFLHASSIIFEHPFTKKETRIEAPLAVDLKIVMKRLEWQL